MLKYTIKPLVVGLSLIIAGNATAAQAPKRTPEQRALEQARLESLRTKEQEDQRKILAESRRTAEAEARRRAEKEALDRAIRASKITADQKAEKDAFDAAIKASLAIAQPAAASQQDMKAGHALNKPAAQDQKQQKEVMGYCTICMETLALVKLSCGHEFCKPCLNGLVDATIKDGRNTTALRCPNTKCKKEIEMHDVAAITTAQKAGKVADIKTKETLAKDKDAIQCPTPNCTMIYLNDRNALCTINCAECKKSYCSKCKVNHDRKITCEQHKKINAAYAQYKNEEWIKKNTKQCPRCFVHIEKNNGCNVMHCEECGQGFCWVCTKPRAHHGPHDPKCGDIFAGVNMAGL